MENTPNDQYPGYSLREFKETFERRFKGFSDVNKRIRTLLEFGLVLGEHTATN